MAIIPNLAWARDPYNTAYAESNDLDCSRDIATERAKGQRPEDANVSASRVTEVVAPAASTPVPTAIN